VLPHLTADERGVSDERRVVAGNLGVEVRADTRQLCEIFVVEAQQVVELRGPR